VNWIDCNERKPANMRPVLVVYLGRTQWIAYRWCRDHWEPTEDGSDDAPADAFTHWMPLPDPPGERAELNHERFARERGED
jgi:hypothetical protein